MCFGVAAALKKKLPQIVIASFWAHLLYTIAFYLLSVEGLEFEQFELPSSSSLGSTGREWERVCDNSHDKVFVEAQRASELEHLKVRLFDCILAIQ